MVYRSSGLLCQRRSRSPSRSNADQPREGDPVQCGRMCYHVRQRVKATRTAWLHHTTSRNWTRNGRSNAILVGRSDPNAFVPFQSPKSNQTLPLPCIPSPQRFATHAHHRSSQLTLDNRLPYAAGRWSTCSSTLPSGPKAGSQCRDGISQTYRQGAELGGGLELNARARVLPDVKLHACTVRQPNHAP